MRVYGIPIAQGRPRAVRLPTGHVRLYDPAQSKDWKRTVMAQVFVVRPATWAVTRSPLTVGLEFFLARPKSAPKRQVWPAKRPDLDNLAKSVLDALRGLVYHDDAQIVRLDLSKQYGEPGVVIRIQEASQCAKSWS